MLDLLRPYQFYAGLAPGTIEGVPGSSGKFNSQPALRSRQALSRSVASANPRNLLSRTVPSFDLIFSGPRQQLLEFFAASALSLRFPFEIYFGGERTVMQNRLSMRDGQSCSHRD